METTSIIATTLYGLEKVLAGELEAMGAQGVKPLNRAVRFTGSRETLYDANLRLRTAIKVLLPIGGFEARDEQELYDGVKSIAWDKYLSVKKSFAIDAVVNGGVFTHSHYAALKSKDAIADYFQERFRLRPSVNTDFPDVRINLHISGRTAIVSLDSSGTPLGRRGYRTSAGEAPISENLAAGILLLTGWDRRRPLVDPMCGSGTFAIEAAMMARGMAPGRGRKFGFEKWADFDAGLWERVKARAEAEIHPATARVWASDIARKALADTTENARRAGVRGDITVEGRDFFESAAPEAGALVVMNPPYDERMRLEATDEFYAEIGDQLKHNYTGSEAWIISSNIGALKHLGLHATSKTRLYNGPLECRLASFDVYEGTRRHGGDEDAGDGTDIENAGDIGTDIDTDIDTDTGDAPATHTGGETDNGAATADADAPAGA